MAEPDAESFQPLVFGETFGTKVSANYHSLQYKFKPQSAGRKGPGSIKLDANAVALQLPNAYEGYQNITFEGKWAPSQPGVDCVAIFDGSQWRLELLHGTATNIRHLAAQPKVDAGSAGSPGAPANAAFSGDSGAELSTDKSQEKLEGDTPAPAQDAADRYPPSTTPSITLRASTTPSLSRQESPDASPAVVSEPNLEESVQQAERPEGPGDGASPSVLPGSSSPQASSGSSSSSESEGEVQGQAQKWSKQVLECPPVPREDVQDFEREFFENDSDDESDHGGSESSGNQSEEEAKHF